MTTDSLGFTHAHGERVQIERTDLGQQQYDIAAFAAEVERVANETLKKRETE